MLWLQEMGNVIFTYLSSSYTLVIGAQKDVVELPVVF